MSLALLASLVECLTVNVHCLLIGCVIIRIAAVFVGLLFFVVAILMILKGDFKEEILLGIPLGALFIYFGISGKDPSSTLEKVNTHKLRR